MEIGGYRELDLRTGMEYYTGDQVIRLNTGRAGIFHALRCLGCTQVYLPYYECSTVREFLHRQGIGITSYRIDRRLRPIFPEEMDCSAAVVLVNYLGLLSNEELQMWRNRFPHLIIDNTQAFFSAPVEGAYNVYSPRKFVGVSDGCYVIGPCASLYVEQYPEDRSAETSSFLLRRIESGGNTNYPFYLENEARLDQSGVRRMSPLTRALLDNVDYERCLMRRRENYHSARELFDGINQLPLDILDAVDKDAAPIAYPLVIERVGLRQTLKAHQIFVGQWWKYLLEEQADDTAEAYFTKFLIPIQIDQRYDRSHLEYTKEVVEGHLARADN